MSRHRFLLAVTMFAAGALGICLVMTAPSRAADKAAVPLDKDPALEGWWKFDETKGTIAADASPHKRKGLLQGGLDFEKDGGRGKFGRALRCRGGKTFVEIKNYKGITGTAPRTVTAWIKSRTRRGEIALWGVRDAGKQFRFGHIRGRIGVTPFGGYLYMKEYVDDEKWHHVAVIVRKAELPNLYDDVVLYLDGEVATIDDIGLLDLWPVNTAVGIDVQLGPGFDGWLDDVRIYKRPLSDIEIKTLYRGKSSQPTPKS